MVGQQEAKRCQQVTAPLEHEPQEALRDKAGFRLAAGAGILPVRTWLGQKLSTAMSRA